MIDKMNWKKTKKGKAGHILFGLLVLVIFGVVGTSFYLFLQFGIGDFVYNSDTGLVGEIKAVSLPKDYLVQWQDGNLSRESLFNIRKLSELSDLEVLNLLEKEKTPEIYFDPGEAEEEGVKELLSIRDMSGIDVEPKLGEKGNFVFVIGEEGCKPNFVCSAWSDCQAGYDLKGLITEELVSGFQYRYCNDYSKCVSDFVDSKKCETKIPITTKKVQLGDKEYTEIYDEQNILISRLALVNETYNKLEVQMLFDESAYAPYCYDGIKNFDEDEVDCVLEKDGNCPSCEQKFYARKGNYLLMLLILIGLIILCLIFIIWYVILIKRK